jgi:hypothetical protein
MNIHPDGYLMSSLKRLFQKPGHHSKWVNITFWVTLLLYVCFSDGSTGDKIYHIFHVLLLSNKLLEESYQMPVVWLSHLQRDIILPDNYQLPFHVSCLSYLVLFAENPRGMQGSSRQWQLVVVGENKDPQFQAHI